MENKDWREKKKRSSTYHVRDIRRDTSSDWETNEDQEAKRKGELGILFHRYSSSGIRQESSIDLQAKYISFNEKKKKIKLTVSSMQANHIHRESAWKIHGNMRKARSGFLLLLQVMKLGFAVAESSRWRVKSTDFDGPKPYHWGGTTALRVENHVCYLLHD